MTTYKDLLRIFNPYNIPFAHLFSKVIDFFAGATSQNDPEEYTYEELCEIMDKGNVEPNRLYKMNYTPLIISDVYESDNNIYEIILKGKTYNKFYDEVKIHRIITNNVINFNEIKLLKPLIINCTSSSIQEIKSITLTDISPSRNKISGRVTGASSGQYPPIELYLSDLTELIDVLNDDYVNTTISLNKTITPANYAGFLGSLTLIGTVNVEAECDRILNVSDLDMNGVYNFDRDYKYGIKNKLIKSLKNDIDIYAKPILSNNVVIPTAFDSNLYFLKETNTEIIFTTKTNSVTSTWCELVIDKNNYKFGTLITASIHLYISNELDSKLNRDFILYDPKQYNGYITNINYKTKNNICVDVDYDFFNYIKVLNDVKCKYFNKSIPVLFESDYNIILKSDTAIPYTFIKNKDINFRFDIYSYNSKENIIELSKLNENPGFEISGRINLNASDNNTIVIYDAIDPYDITIDFSNSHDNNILITYKNTTIKDCAFYNCNELDEMYYDELYNHIYKRSSMTFINCCNGNIDTTWLSENIILENIEGSYFSIEFKTETPYEKYCRGLTHIRNIGKNARFKLELYTQAQEVHTVSPIMFDGFDGIFIPTGSFVHKWIPASHRLYDIVPFHSYNTTGDEINKNTGYKFQSENNTFITID